MYIIQPSVSARIQMIHTDCLVQYRFMTMLLPEKWTCICNTCPRIKTVYDKDMFVLIPKTVYASQQSWRQN